MVTITSCPDAECFAPAEEVDRYLLESTSGPVLHVATFCVSGHRLVHIEEG
jgi:hypothetical protein